MLGTTWCQCQEQQADNNPYQSLVQCHLGAHRVVQPLVARRHGGRHPLQGSGEVPLQHPRRRRLPRARPIHLLQANRMARSPAVLCQYLFWRLALLRSRNEPVWTRSSLPHCYR